MIPVYFDPSLALDRASGTWRVTSHDAQASAVVTSAGSIRGDSVRTIRLPSILPGGRRLHTYRDGTSLVGTFHESFRGRQMLLAMFGFYPYQWDVWHAGNGDRQPVGALPGFPECRPQGNREENVLCVVRERFGLSLWKLGPRNAIDPTSIGTLPANLDLWDIGTDGKLAAAARDGSTLMVVDVSSGRGTRVTLDGIRLQSAQPMPHTYAADVAVAGHRRSPRRRRPAGAGGVLPGEISTLSTTLTFPFYSSW